MSAIESLAWRVAMIRRASLTVLLLSGTAWGQPWMPGAPAPMDALWGRGRAAMAFDASRGRVVVFGGSNEGTLYGNDTWEFDGAAWVKGPLAPPGLRARASAGLAYDSRRSRIVMFGGFDRSGEMNDTWEMDAGGWRPGPAAPPVLVPRRVYGMAYDTVRGRSVIYGGAGAGGAYLDDTWELDGVTWRQGPASPAALGGRVSHTIAFDPTRSRVLLFGGSGPGGYKNDLWVYDGTAWAPGVTAPAGLVRRSGSSMVHDSALGRMILFGGYSGSAYLSDTWELDATSWRAGPAAPPPLAPRSRHAMAFDAGRGRTVMFGGLGASLKGDTWLYDGSSWAAGPPETPALTPRSGSAAAYDPSRGRVVIFGGAAYFGTNQTWEYDGASWTFGPQAPPGLGGRWAAAMVFDAFRSCLVLAGGDTGGAVLDDVWELQSFWYPAPSMPWPLSAHAMTFDTQRNCTVLFGGWNGVAATNDTIEYDGIVWTQRPVAPTALSPRFYHALAYLPSRRATVLFGGTDLQGWPFDDTWEYDGSAWTGRPTPPGMAGQSGHAMVTGGEPERVILFGGYGFPTWEYDGSWSRGGAPPSVLVGRVHQAAALDSDRGKLVLFGGYRVGDIPQNDTWEYSTRPEDFVAGAGHGFANQNRVKVLAPDGRPTVVDFFAYPAAHWGTNVATGEIGLGAGPEILTGPGPGAVYGPQVRAFRADGTGIAKVNFFAYSTLRYGVNVGSGNVVADFGAEILTGSGPGGMFGPHVRGFTFGTGTVTAVPGLSYFAYSSLAYGVVVDAGALDGVVDAEILTAPGPGPALAPAVRGWNLIGSTIAPLTKVDFAAFPILQYGARIATGNVDLDPFDEILATPGPGPGASFPGRFKGFGYDGQVVAPMPGFDVTPFATAYGGRVGAGSVKGDATEDLMAGAGPDPAADSTVQTFEYTGLSLNSVVAPFEAISGTTHGVNVASGDLGL